ncbi:MAG TPA: PDZ domain-containing protein [Candidatus Polarisedimenticolaceae bacterium]|nr:PDZ domain-containing protein [Candidatus Polarisedimenticolaceae bacterium]
MKKESTLMQDRDMRRSWTIAALSAAAGAGALTFGLFLAIGRDTVAGDKVTVVSPDGHDHVNVYKLVTGDDGEGDGKTGFLGVDVREDTKSSEGGALVESVVEDSPAEKAGLREGDVIVGFSGDVIRGPGKLTEKIHATKPGDSVTLDIRRGGKSQKLTVQMGTRPHFSYGWHSGDDSYMTDAQREALEESLKNLDVQIPKIRERLGKIKIGGPGGYRVMVFGDKPLLGVELVHTTAELREAMGGRKDAGVLVGKVLSGSAAEKAGMKVGDLILSVDGHAVSDPDELGDAIREREGKTVDVELVRDKRTMHLKATLPEMEESEDEPTGPQAWIWRAAPVAPAPAIAPPLPPAAVAPPAPAPPAVPAVPAVPMVGLFV